MLVFFSEKYDYVGRLIRPGEKPRDYSDEETEASETGGENPESPEVTPKGRSQQSTPTQMASDDAKKAG